MSSRAAAAADLIVATAIGDLPKSWEIKRLGQIFDVQQGKALSRAARMGLSRRPFLRTANVFWGRVNLHAVDQMHFTAEEAARLSLRSGDLLVCEGGEIGRAAVWRSTTEGYSFQNHIHRLRANVSSVDPEFVMYWLQAAFVHLGTYQGVGNRTTIPNLSASRLRQLFVPQPPIAEQRAVSSVLSKLQAVVELQDKLVAKLKELKAATLARLFREGLRGEPLKETKVGEIPESWDVQDLERFATVLGGKRLPKGEPFAVGRTPFPYIRVVDLRGHSVDATQVKYLTHEVHRQIERYVISHRDVYISIAGTTGLVGVVPPGLDGANLTENAARLVLRETGLDRDFLMCFLAGSGGQEQIASLTMKTSQPKLALARIQSIQIPVPVDVAEQREIAEGLGRIQRAVVAAEMRVASMRRLFATMINVLVTGHVRLLQPNGKAEGAVTQD